MILTRYDRASQISSYRDPLQDLLVFAEFLLSEDYATEVLINKHGVTFADAKKRAPRIGPHVKTALAYLNQATAGPADVAFLPIYYALLNLIKVYILFSAKHQQLNSNRWHGASYDVYARKSHSLRTELVKVHPRGAIPLFYEVITGAQIHSITKIKMGDVYPYIADVGLEWAVATGGHFALRGVVFNVLEEPSGKKVHALVGRLPNERLSVGKMPALVRFRPSPGNAQEFFSRDSHPSTVSDIEAVRAHVNSFLFYYPRERDSIMPICQKRMMMFEELPIVLAFFHLSSVVRYNPELLARIHDSRFWPIVSSLRFHAVTKFMLLFWSFIQQETIIFTRGTA